MPSKQTIDQQAADLYKKYGSKANVARELLDRGFSVSEISKAVPMSYSQVHSINKARQPVESEDDRWAKAGREARAALGVAKAIKVDLGMTPDGDMSRTKITPKGLPPGTHQAELRSVKLHTYGKGGKIAAIEPPSPAWGHLPSTGKPSKKPAVSKTRLAIGKLRTPGLPSDTAVGKCANCGYDLVVRKLPTGLTLVHTNISAEEFLAEVQFCQAVPEVLMS